MKLESVKCPNCGAPVVALNADGTVMCRACSSLLHVTGDKSGFPVVRPIDTGEDASFFSTLQAADRLREKLSQLDAAETQSVAEPNENGKSCAGCFVATVGLGLLALGVVSLSLDAWWVSLGFFLIAFCALAVAGSLFTQGQQQKSAQAATKTAIARKKQRKIQGERQRIERQIAALERKLDELTSNM